MPENASKIEDARFLFVAKKPQKENHMSIRKFLAGSAVAGVLLTGALVDTTQAPEAAAAECVQNVTIWQAYNKCAGVPARHWDAIKNSTPKYGNWATAGNWSNQAACWPNVVSYGYSLKA